MKKVYDSYVNYFKKVILKDGSEAYINKLVNEDLFRAYDKEGNVIGAAAFDTTPKDHFTGYEVNVSIQVPEDKRRNGIATSIIKFAEEYYGIQRCRKVILLL